MPSKRFWRFRFGYYPDDERFLLPRFGILNTRAEDAIASCWLAEDGKLELYVNWLCVEVSFRVLTRPAKGIKGVL